MAARQGWQTRALALPFGSRSARLRASCARRASTRRRARSDAPHEHDSSTSRPRRRPRAARPASELARLGRDPLPQRGGEHRARASTARARGDGREHGIAGEVVVADNASEDRSAELAAAAGARVVHEPRRGYGSAYLAGFAAARGALHRHGRRRPHLRLRRDPALRRAARRRRRARHGRPDGQHPARARCRGCTATSATRCSPASSTSSSAPASATRTAACARCAATSCRALDLRTTGHGVRLRDGHPGLEGEARHPRVPDRVPPARRRVASSRASATAGATCASCSSTARRTCSCIPGAVHGRARRADRADRCSRRSTSSAARGTCTR